jgi:hypothetical protein
MGNSPSSQYEHPQTSHTGNWAPIRGATIIMTDIEMRSMAFANAIIIAVLSFGSLFAATTVFCEIEFEVWSAQRFRTIHQEVFGKILETADLRP